MDAPPIQYARTEDGVSIAYTASGEGPPLVYLQPFTHQQLDWSIPELSAWYESLAAEHRLIRFDGRRFGLSTRSEEPLSLATWIADLRAVVNHLGLEQFDLMGISGQALTAIAFAAAEPERVGKLLLWAAVMSGKDFRRASTRVRAIDALWEIDPQISHEILIRGMFGEDAMSRPECVTHMHQAATAADMRSYQDAVFATDTTDELPRVAAATLLLYPQGLTYSSLDNIQAIAAGIADCEVYYCEADVYPHRGENPEARLRKINQFLQRSPIDDSAPGRLRREDRFANRGAVRSSRRGAGGLAGRVAAYQNFHHGRRIRIVSLAGALGSTPARAPRTLAEIGWRASARAIRTSTCDGVKPGG